MNTILSALDEAIESYAQRTAVVARKSTLSYAEFGARIERMAEMLRPLAETSRHIGICLLNSAECLIIYYAALRVGCLPFLLDASFQDGELAAVRDDCALGWLIADRAKRDSLGLPVASVVEIAPGICLAQLTRGDAPSFDPAATTVTCRFTSGTTGRPKCIEFSGIAVHAAALNWARGTGLVRDDRTLCLAAISNGLAFNTSILSTFMVGAQVHVAQGLPVASTVARKIAEDRITRLVAFPTVYRVLSSDETLVKDQLATLRCAVSAGAPLWQHVRERFSARFDRHVADYYGIAETGPVTFEQDGIPREGLGRPLPGADLRVTEEGEVLVKTASMATRYMNLPGVLEARIDADGFYHSGDLGELRDERLFLRGRFSTFINVAGRKIDPEEVAQAAMAISGINDAIAVSAEGADGETFLHLIVAGADTLRRAQVIDGCRGRIAAWKLPGRITVVSKIPRNGIGKPILSEVEEIKRRGAHCEGEEDNERRLRSPIV